MKTKLLRKLRKKSNREIYATQIWNDWDCSSVYKVTFAKNRARHYQTSKCAYAFIDKKRRQYILNQIRWIRTKSITFPR